MKAIRYYGRGDVRLEEVAEPRPRPGEVTLRVHANGICGSDVYEYSSGPSATSHTPHPLTGVRLPVILGHELAGTVVETGEGVSDLAADTLVAIEPVQGCRTCARCRHGRANLCRPVAFHGLHRDGGGLAEFTVVPRSMVHVVPPGVTAELVGKRAVVVDPSADRRRVAADLGAEQVLDPVSDDVVGAVRELTDGYGAAGAVDAAGVPSVVRLALAGTRPDGTVVIVALLHRRRLPVSSDHLMYHEVHLTGSMAYAGEFPAVLANMARGDYRLDGWVSRACLDRLVPDGLEPLARQEAIKVLVRIHPD